MTWFSSCCGTVHWGVVPTQQGNMRKHAMRCTHVAPEEARTALDGPESMTVQEAFGEWMEQVAAYKKAQAANKNM